MRHNSCWPYPLPRAPAARSGACPVDYGELAAAAEQAGVGLTAVVVLACVENISAAGIG